MMLVKMVEGEVRVVKFAHMESSKDSIESSRFVHHFMGNSELRGCQVRSDENDANQVQ